MDIENIFPTLKASFLENLPQLDWREVFANTHFQVEGNIHPSASIANDVSIGIETVVEPFVVIEEDVIIGKHCLIRSGALLRSGTIIGDYCVIGHNAEIKHSYIFEHAKVQGGTFVGDSVVGKGARIGTGTVIGNRRFDQEEISWSMNDGEIKTGRDKLGALIGEYVRLGANVTTNPGTVIGAYTWVSGGTVVGGYLPPKKFIKLNGEIVENNKGGELQNMDQGGSK